MNDTPQGDGNIMFSNFIFVVNFIKIRMNDTPQGDGNLLSLQYAIYSTVS